MKTFSSRHHSGLVLVILGSLGTMLASTVACGVTAEIAKVDDDAGTPIIDLPDPDGGRPSRDAGKGAQHDAASDANDGSMPPTGGPTVVVLGNGSHPPQAGVTVVFQDANGEVVESVVTGADGRATASAKSSSSIHMATALIRYMTSPEFITWVGVSPTDVLTAINPQQGGLPPSNLFTITLPGAYPGANHHTAGIMSCQVTMTDPTKSLSTSLSADCVAATNPFLGIAWDISTTPATPLAFASVKGVAAPPASAVLGAWAPAVPLPVEIINAPADTNGTQVDVRVIEDGRNLVQYHPSSLHSFSVPDGLADATQSRALMTFGSGCLGPPPCGDGGWRTIEMQVAGTPASITHDGSTALPAITAFTTDRTDPNRPLFAWTSNGSLASTSGGNVAFLFTGGNWSFIVPPSATTLKVPALPADATATLGLSTSFMEPYATFFDNTLIASYADVRRLDSLTVLSNTKLTKPGQIRTTYFHPPQVLP
jgi:hypothetical protein